MKLVKLTKEYKSQLFDMMEEWLSVEQDFSPYMIRRNDYRDFEYYLENLEIKEETEDRVPDSIYFALDEERNIFLGAIDIRHYLNHNLCHTGGHIGDGIRPSERRKGYATEMIGLALEKCRELGMKKVMMTCDKDNIGSAKSIMNNGGILEMEVEEDGVLEQRYWITLEDEVVETEHLFMTRLMPEHYEEVFTWRGDARVNTYLLVDTIEKAEDLIPWLESNDSNSIERYVMMIRSKEDEHAIGIVGMFYDKERDIWTPAYCIAYEDWGKGYTTEATRGLMDYVIRKHGAHQFEVEAAVENMASRRVIEKLGFVFDHDATYSKHDGSKTFDSKVYRLEIGA